jgi:hypothetical protein
MLGHIYLDIDVGGKAVPRKAGLLLEAQPHSSVQEGWLRKEPIAQGGRSAPGDVVSCRGNEGGR